MTGGSLRKTAFEENRLCYNITLCDRSSTLFDALNARCPNMGSGIVRLYRSFTESFGLWISPVQARRVTSSSTAAMRSASS